jgi:hypothetical protein
MKLMTNLQVRLSTCAPANSDCRARRLSSQVRSKSAAACELTGALDRIEPRCHPIRARPRSTGSSSWCYVTGCGDEYVSARFDCGVSVG